MSTQGYRNTPTLKEFYFPVSDDHELHVEIIGNPEGIPVVFFHGGPGASINEKCRWFFNPEKYYVVLFDQRGTGKSKPFLGLQNNTPFATIEDAEALRKHLGIERWIVFGGSYGTTLGLLYGILHPEVVMHMVFRGIFLGREEDVDWLFQEGAGYFYPENFEKFKSFIPKEKQQDLVSAYYELMTGEDKETARLAAKQWADWENGILRIEHNEVKEEIEDGDLSAGLLESHYFAHKMFWENDNFLLDNSHKLKDIPMDIFHGRFDVDCRPKGAYELKQHCPHAHLGIVQTGSHYPYDSPLFDRLVDKMDELAEVYG